MFIIWLNWWLNRQWNATNTIVVIGIGYVLIHVDVWIVRSIVDYIRGY